VWINVVTTTMQMRTLSSPSADTEPGIHARRPMSDAVCSAGPFDACRMQRRGSWTGWKSAKWQRSARRTTEIR